MVHLSLNQTVLHKLKRKQTVFDYCLYRWFMPVNVGLTFLFGGILGWIAMKILKPKPHLEGLIIATCSSGNS